MKPPVGVDQVHGRDALVPMAASGLEGADGAFARVAAAWTVPRDAEAAEGEVVFDRIGGVENAEGGGDLANRREAGRSAVG